MVVVVVSLMARPVFPHTTHQDDTRIECWSAEDPPIEQFSQSLPGQLGKLPLIVGADRLIVHFHTAKHTRRPKTKYTITLQVGERTRAKKTCDCGNG